LSGDALGLEQRVQEQAGALALRARGQRHVGAVLVAAEVADLAAARVMAFAAAPDLDLAGQLGSQNGDPVIRSTGGGDPARGGGCGRTEG